MCVCESIMETRHAGNANKKEVPHKMLAQSDSGGGIGQRDSQAKAKAAGYAYQIETSAPQDIQHFIDSGN